MFITVVDNKLIHKIDDEEKNKNYMATNLKDETRKNQLSN